MVGNGIGACTRGFVHGVLELNGVESSGTSHLAKSESWAARFFDAELFVGFFGYRTWSEGALIVLH